MQNEKACESESFGFQKDTLVCYDKSTKLIFAVVRVFDGRMYAIKRKKVLILRDKRELFRRVSRLLERNNQKRGESV